MHSECNQRHGLLQEWNEAVRLLSKAANKASDATIRGADFDELLRCSRAARGNVEQVRQAFVRHRDEHGCG
jgi:hypothetical protein